jgi:hypothetical protein
MTPKQAVAYSRPEIENKHFYSQTFIIKLVMSKSI